MSSFFNSQDLFSNSPHLFLEVSLYICDRNLFLDQDNNFFHYPFVGYCRDILGRSYMLITSGSLRVEQHDVIHCYLNFTQHWNIQDLFIPYKFVQTAANTNSAEQLQYITLMPISKFWQDWRENEIVDWLTWKVIDEEALRLHLTQTIFYTSLV